MCKHLERRHLLTRIGVKGPLKPKNQRESCIGCRTMTGGSPPFCASRLRINHLPDTWRQGAHHVGSPENAGPRRGGQRHGPHDHQQQQSGALRKFVQHLVLLNESSKPHE